MKSMLSSAIDDFTSVKVAREWYETRESRDKEEKPWDVPVRDLLFEEEDLVEED